MINGMLMIGCFMYGMVKHWTSFAVLILFVFNIALTTMEDKNVG